MADTMAIRPGPPPAPRWRPPDPSRFGGPRIVGILLVGGAGIAIGVVRFVGEERYQSTPERLLQALAFGLLVASPAVLAALSPRRRAILLVPAALLLTPLAMLSLTGVLLPLLIPAILFWTALVTRWDRMPCGGVRAAAAVVVVLGCVIVGGIALFAQQDPRTYGDTSGCTFDDVANRASGSCPTGPGAGGSGGTSDVVTPVEAGTSLTLVVGGIAAGWVLAAPARGARSTRPGVRGRAGR